MKVLELFAGTRSIGKAFEAHGHEVYSVEWNKDFENIDWYEDIGKITAQDIIERFGKPDVIWASPDCTSYSVSAISHHRRKNPETGELEPVSEYAKFCDAVNKHVIELIKELNPKYYFIENPVGGLRKMSFMQGLPRYTTTYCFTGDTKFITSKGLKTLKDMEGKNVEVLNIHGEWEYGTVHKYGKDRIYKITLSRAGKIFEVYTTASHKWFAAHYKNKNKYLTKTTLELEPKMYLPSALPPQPIENFKLIPEWVCRGFIYGDGWVLKNDLNRGSFIQFCNEKQELMPYFEPFWRKAWKDDKDNCFIMKANGFPTDWKTTTPTCSNSPDEIFSWLAGYFAADGHCSVAAAQISLSSATKQNLEIVRELAEHIGIGTYQIHESWRKGYGKEETPLYQVTFMRKYIPQNFLLRSRHLKAYNDTPTLKHQAMRYSIISVEPTERYEDVYCCETQTTHTFTLENNIVTHNCQYGERRQKPTDIWTNHPDPQFKPPCKRGASCHDAAPRGSRTGTQGLKNAREKARIPVALCNHIVDICEMRICTCCGKPMMDGYCINDGDKYFCSNDCLHSTYSEKKYEELYAEDAAYWTQWELGE